MNRKLDYNVAKAERRPGWMLLMGLHKAAHIASEADKLDIGNRVFVSIEDWEGFDGQMCLILKDNLARSAVVQPDNNTLYDILYWMKRVVNGRITFGPYTVPVQSKWYCKGGELLTVGARWNTADNAVILFFEISKDGKVLASVTVHTSKDVYKPGNLMFNDGSYVAQSDHDAADVWFYRTMEMVGRAL